MSKDSTGTKRTLSLLWQIQLQIQIPYGLCCYMWRRYKWWQQDSIQVENWRHGLDLFPEYKYTDTSMKYRIQIHRYIHEIQNTNTQIHLWNIEYKYTDTSKMQKKTTQTINSYTNKYDIVREIQTLSQNTQIDGWTDSKEGWVILYVISDTFLKRMYLYLYLYLHMIPFCSACIWRPSWGLKAGPLIQSSSEKQFKIRITRK